MLIRIMWVVEFLIKGNKFYTRILLAEGNFNKVAIKMKALFHHLGMHISIKAFKIVFRYALKNAMYCYLRSYSCTSSGTRILPEVS